MLPARLRPALLAVPRPLPSAIGASDEGFFLAERSATPNESMYAPVHVHAYGAGMAMAMAMAMVNDGIRMMEQK